MKFARITTIEGVPERIDESIHLFKESVVPEARKMQGFNGLYLLVDWRTGKSVVIELWETEADLKASAEAAKRLRAEKATAQPAKVEVYEVAVQP